MASTTTYQISTYDHDCDSIYQILWRLMYLFAFYCTCKLTPVCRVDLRNITYMALHIWQQIKLCRTMRFVIVIVFHRIDLKMLCFRHNIEQYAHTCMHCGKHNCNSYHEFIVNQDRQKCFKKSFI